MFHEFSLRMFMDFLIGRLEWRDICFKVVKHHIEGKSINIDINKDYMESDMFTVHQGQLKTIRRKSLSIKQL